MGRSPRRIYPADTRVARRIKAIRRELGKHQDEIAAGLQLPRSAVAEIEAGRRAVTVGELVEICQVLGVEVAAIVADGRMPLPLPPKYVD